jgi:hypothetical protein
MLTYLLALVVALGSLSFYMAAFFVPEIHRRQDFLWSGVGLFYALVLWSCAGRITGAVLLGQIAGVSLVVWLGWQTLTLRRELTPTEVQTPATWADVQRWGIQMGEKVQGYFKAESIAAGLVAVGQDLQGALQELRDRIAGPRAKTPKAPDRTPLRHEPPYEWVDESGQREAVPPEPAPLAARGTDRDDSSEAPEATPAPELKASRPSVPRREGLKLSDRRQSILSTLTTLKDWSIDLVRSFTKPKPKRAVINIPPRSPAIPRSEPPPPQEEQMPDADVDDGV